MFSALAMVRMAAMAGSGSRPEKVSEKIEARLDWSGEWEVGIEQNNLPNALTTKNNAGSGNEVAIGESAAADYDGG